MPEPPALPEVRMSPTGHLVKRVESYYVEDGVPKPWLSLALNGATQGRYYSDDQVSSYSELVPVDSLADTVLDPSPGQAVLACPMDISGNDVGAATVGEYLAQLLVQVWIEEEGFDGKRPFGNSGWKAEVWVALIRHGLVLGTLNEDGYVESLDEDAADHLVYAAIRELGK